MIKTYGTPGGYAATRSSDLADRWRRRVLTPFTLGSGALAGLAVIAGLALEGRPKYWTGFIAGAVVAFYLSVREMHPAHIAKWQRGAEGERRTAKALRSLAGDWTIAHDIQRDGRANFDHVVVGEAGVFLLDTKDLAGEARIENGELKISWVDDPDDGWTCSGLVMRMRAASAALKQQIEAEAGVRTWVQAVVVIWGRFPEGAAIVNDVHFVRGEQVASWLNGRDRSARRFDREAVERWLSQRSPSSA